MNALGLALGTPFKRVGGGPFKTALQWITGAFTSPSTLNDRTTPAYDVNLVQSDCIIIGGGTEYAAPTKTLPVDAVVENGGTAVILIDTNSGLIGSFDSGTCWDIRIWTDATKTTLWAQLPCAKGSGSWLENTVDPDNPFAITTADLDTFRSGKTDAYHSNAKFGGSQVLDFNGTDSLLTVDNSTTLFQFGSDDFVIELDVFFTTKTPSTNEHFLSKCATADTEWLVYRTMGGRIYLLTSSNGTTISQRGMTAENYELGWNTISISKAGAVVAFKVDGVDKISTGNIDVTVHSSTNSVFFGGDGAAKAFAGDLSRIKVITGGAAIEWTAKNAYGDVLPHPTYPATLYNVALPIYPALADGTDDTAGLGITNPPIGVGVAGANWESLYTQLAGSAAALGHISLFFEADETTLKQFSFADIKAWVSGTDGLWVGMSLNDKGTCIVTGWVAFPADHSYTAAEYLKIIAEYPNTCGGGTLAFGVL